MLKTLLEEEPGAIIMMMWIASDLIAPGSTAWILSTSLNYWQGCYISVSMGSRGVNPWTLGCTSCSSTLVTYAAIRDLS